MSNGNESPLQLLSYWVLAGLSGLIGVVTGIRVHGVKIGYIEERLDRLEEKIDRLIERGH